MTVNIVMQKYCGIAITALPQFSQLILYKTIIYTHTSHYYFAFFCKWKLLNENVSIYFVRTRSLHVIIRIICKNEILKEMLFIFVDTRIRFSTIIAVLFPTHVRGHPL